MGPAAEANVWPLRLLLCFFPGLPSANAVRASRKSVAPDGPLRKKKTVGAKKGCLDGGEESDGEGQE